MDASTAHSSSRSSVVTLALVSVGFAVFLSAVWTARTDAAFVPDYTLHLARFVKVAGCFVIAYLFRSYIPSVPRLLGVGVSCEAIHLLCHATIVVLPPEALEYVPAAVMSGVFAGVGEACVTLLFAHLFSTFEPRMSAVAIPVAYLLNEVFYCAALYLPAEALTVVRPAFKAVGIAVLVVCLSRKRSVDGSAGELQMQYGLPQGPQSRFFAMLSKSQEWTLLLVSTTLFPFVFGLVAHICSSAGLRSGLYDVPNELFAIGVLAMLVIYGAIRGTRFTFDGVLCLVIPLFATGCLLLPVLSSMGYATAGTMVKCAYTLYQVMFWMLLARKCYEDPRHVYLYFGVFYGTFELATALARLLGSWLNPTFADDAMFVPMVAVGSLWLMSMYGLVFFVILRKWEQRRSPSEVQGVAAPSARQNPGAVAEDDSVSGEAPSTGDGFVGKLDAFCDAFGFSPREKDVLVESIHGYSMENIGKKLFISRETVKTHLRRMYAKAGVSSKQELVSLIDEFPNRPKGQ